MMDIFYAVALGIHTSVVAGKSDKWYIKNNAVDILKLK